MKAAKRKRAAAAPARTASAVTSDVAEQAAPSVATEQALPAVPVIIEDAAAEAVLVAEMPAVAVVNVKVDAAAPGSQPVVTLGSNCTVKDAATLKQSLCAVLNSEAAVIIDIGAVDRIDTAAIQLLCAFVRQRAADAHGVVWRGTPAALREAAGLLGVCELLMLPAEAGAAP
jgi:phospholipid transport system transporter-binding protein